MSSRRRTSKRSSGRVLRLSSASAASQRTLENLVRRGPLTLILVFSHTCGHCRTYAPLWSELERVKSKKANLVSMPATVYDKMPMSATKPVQAVPTVLYVNNLGEISEVQSPRDRSNMMKMVNTGVPETLTSSSPMFTPASSASLTPAANTGAMTNTSTNTNASAMTSTNTSAEFTPVIPGTSVASNPLPTDVARTISPEPQMGGNPWTAFMAAAQQAGPAAVLLGAYAAGRASGLPAPVQDSRRRTRKRTSK